MQGEFLNEVEEIIPFLAPQRQNLLFSATMTSDLDLLKRVAMKDPYSFDACPVHTTVDTLRQYYVLMPALVKDTYLVYLLTQFKGQSTIIFAAKKRYITPPSWFVRVSCFA